MDGGKKQPCGERISGINGNWGIPIERTCNLTGHAIRLEKDGQNLTLCEIEAYGTQLERGIRISVVYNLNSYLI